VAAIAVNSVLNHLWLRRGGTKLLSGADWLDFGKIMAAALCMAGAVILTVHWLDLGRLSETLIAVALGAMVYALLLLLFREREVTGLLSRLRGKDGRA